MKKLFFILIALCGILMTGCAQLVTLDENQSDILAEYMAGTVLRHSNNYEEALIYPVETAKDTKKEKQAVTAEVQEQTGNNVINKALQTGQSNKAVEDEKTVSVGNIFKNISGGDFKVVYKDYTLYDSYPETNGYFTMEPAKGKKILEVTFMVTNLSEKNLDINLIKKNVSYKLTDSKGNTYSSMLTLLENDLQFLNLSIPKGKSKKAVVLFEVSKDISKNGIKFYTTYNSKTAVIELSE